jgi:DNA-binding response OmpR family regulator
MKETCVMTASKLPHTISALAIGEFEHDRRLLHTIFRDLGWRLFEACDRRRAMQCLERHPVDVVIAESDLPNWNWKKVLNDIRRLAPPPQLIVTSRTADDYLWAEVLNIGGYDVLPQPFDRDEVERVIAAAHRHYAFPPARATAGSTTAVVPYVA